MLLEMLNLEIDMKIIVICLLFLAITCNLSIAQKVDTTFFYAAKVSEDTGNNEYHVQFWDYTVGDTIAILTQENVLIKNIVFGHDGIKQVAIDKKYTSFKIQSVGATNKNTSKTVCFDFKGFLNKNREWKNFCLSFRETLLVETNLMKDADKKKMEFTFFNLDTNSVKIYVYHNLKAGRIDRKDTIIINSKPFLISTNSGELEKTCELNINPKKDTILEIVFHNLNDNLDYEKYSKLHLVFSAKSGKENHRDSKLVMLVRNRRSRLTISFKDK